MSKNSKSSTHAGQHPYLRPELLADGTLVFWNTPIHKKEAYKDFYEKQVKDAGRLNKL